MLVCEGRPFAGLGEAKTLLGMSQPSHHSTSQKPLEINDRIVFGVPQGMQKILQRTITEFANCLAREGNNSLQTGIQADDWGEHIIGHPGKLRFWTCRMYFSNRWKSMENVSKAARFDNKNFQRRMIPRKGDGGIHFLNGQWLSGWRNTQEVPPP